LAGLRIEAAEPKEPVFRPYKRAVTTWVPPYAVAKCKARLTADPAIAEALTHLSLQFWTPTKAGGIARARSKDADDAAVAELPDWAHARGIRVLLCVYNAAGKSWDWPLAKSAFADHRADLVKALVAEAERLKLDGVDMDLEGPGDFKADKPAYVAFMAELSKELHARKLQLTVDTFAYKWNAPNQTWWAELLPLADAVVTMGYDETGATAAEWRGYTAQIKAAGEHAAKLQVGVPSDKDKWRGNTAAEHVDWLRKDGRAGVAIWDAQFPAAAWREKGLWDSARGIAMGQASK
jgi:hypothetical protein